MKLSKIVENIDDQQARFDGAIQRVRAVLSGNISDMFKDMFGTSTCSYAGITNLEEGMQSLTDALSGKIPLVEFIGFDLLFRGYKGMSSSAPRKIFEVIQSESVFRLVDSTQRERELLSGIVKSMTLQLDAKYFNTAELDEFGHQNPLELLGVCVSAVTFRPVDIKIEGSGFLVVTLPSEEDGAFLQYPSFEPRLKIIWRNRQFYQEDDLQGVEKLKPNLYGIIADSHLDGITAFQRSQRMYQGLSVNFIRNETRFDYRVLGAPKQNRMRIFEELADYTLKTQSALVDYMWEHHDTTTFDLAFTDVGEDFWSSSKETLYKLAEIYRAGRINFVGKEVHSKIRNALDIMVGLS